MNGYVWYMELKWKNKYKCSINKGSTKLDGWQLPIFQNSSINSSSSCIKINSKLIKK